VRSRTVDAAEARFDPASVERAAHARPLRPPVGCGHDRDGADDGNETVLQVRQGMIGPNQGVCQTVPVVSS